VSIETTGIENERLVGININARISYHVFEVTDITILLLQVPLPFFFFKSNELPKAFILGVCKDKGTRNGFHRCR
jgi:hypothetical protein